MAALRLALRTLRREWRHGELVVLLLSLSVAIASQSGVGFLVDRVGRAIDLQASEVLAADMRIESNGPLAAQDEPQARSLGLRTARLTTLLSAVFHGDANQLANIRAVTDGYPLRGTLRVAPVAFATGEATQKIPAPGETWADSRLAAALDARVGDTLTVGARELRLTQILVARPDQGSGFVDFAATLLINEQDLASTQLVQPTSRMERALLLSGERAQLQAFRRWHAAQPPNRERIQDVSDGSPQIGSAARRAGRFLALAGLVAVLLCAVAVAMSARTYVQRHLDSVALMKTLGATRARVLAASLWQLLALALCATVIGTAAGWVTQAWLVRVLRNLLQGELPAPGLAPLYASAAVAITMLAGFALPSLLQLTRTPALRVLRRDVGPPRIGTMFATLPAMAALGAVIVVTLDDWRLSQWFTLSLCGAALVLALLGAGLVRLAATLRRAGARHWRYGLASLARRRAESVAQIVAFGLAFMLLLVLAGLRRDLVDDWRRLLPQDPPNYFFVNIPTADKDAFREQLTALGGRLDRMLPMVRGRLASINGVPVERIRFGGEPSREEREAADQPTGAGNGPARGGSDTAAGRGRGGGGRGGGLAEREQNLTWAAELGDDNRIVAGRWWSADDAGKPLVSLATEFQEQLGLKLGDQLSFTIAGETLDVTVASFREVKWDSFRPNFFIVFPPGLLDGAAGTYMTSALYTPRAAGDLAQLVQRYPSVSVFNVGDLLAQVRAILDKAVTAVQSVFLFTLLAGLTVMLAAVQASRDERRRETAVLRVLGAQRRTLVTNVLVEFGSLGLLSGLLAASGAAFSSFYLARILELQYRFDAFAWASGVLLGTVIVALSGWLAMRSVLGQPPRAALG